MIQSAFSLRSWLCGSLCVFNNGFESMSVVDNQQVTRPRAEPRRVPLPGIRVIMMAQQSQSTYVWCSPRRRRCRGGPQRPVRVRGETMTRGVQVRRRRAEPRIVMVGAANLNSIVMPTCVSSVRPRTPVPTARPITASRRSGRRTSACHGRHLVAGESGPGLSGW